MPTTSMINANFLEKLHASASMQRWNDHVRPVELTELDKQAHKMLIIYVIGKLEEDAGREVNWLRLIESAIFEFLQRSTLTDIKPQVFRKMMFEKSAELNDWVIDKLHDDIEGVPGDFAAKFERHLRRRSTAAVEDRILRAAHYLATWWEFKIIYSANSFIFGIEETKTEIDNQIEDHIDLVGVQKIMLEKRSYGFIDLCNQLRFQQRWATTPRIPRTSVLGHMFLVAMMTYFASRAAEAGEARITNNFLAALFHDLPEVLTRDIISPIKSAVPGLDGIIKDYESIQIKEKLLPLMPTDWHEQLLYFVEDEFENRVRAVDTGGKSVTRLGIPDDEMGSYTQAEAWPIDGKMIDVCDKLAAFIEACLSVNHGIRSQDLQLAKEDIFERYGEAQAAGIDFSGVFAHFNELAGPSE